ncbi:MAG: molybdopterin-dependent oxidoreductase [Acidobacteria bacterium]|nr:molybdopterin-dependent oxidoreductase [Acidobacteriota bacterium]
MKDWQESLKTADAKKLNTICCFCSCGCGMTASVKEGKLIGLEGDPNHPINQGALCSKGAAAAELHRSPDRIAQPLYRKGYSNSWEAVTWDFALSFIAKKIYQTREKYWESQEILSNGQTIAVKRMDAVAFFGSAVCTNEETYLEKKLALLLGTSYIEHQARL